MSRRYREHKAKGRACLLAMSLEEIGQELGIGGERVRQLEKRALTKAKVILERRGYTLQDLLPDGEHNEESRS